MRHTYKLILTLTVAIAFAGCWSSETSDAPDGGAVVSTGKKAAATSVSDALSFMPEGAMAGMAIPPVDVLEEKYWDLIQGSADAYTKIAGEEAGDPVAAMRKLQDEALAEMAFEDEEVAGSFAEFLSGDGIDTSRSMAIFGRVNEYPPAEEMTIEEMEVGLRVPITDGARFREALEALVKEYEGSMAEGGKTPGGLDALALEIEELSGLVYIGKSEAYLATDGAWIDSMHAHASDPAELPYRSGGPVEPVAGEIAFVYDATELRPLIEAAQKEEGYVAPEGIPRSVLEGEWSVATLRVDADGIALNALGHFIPDSVYAKSQATDLDLLPHVQDEAAAVIAFRLDPSMRDAMLEGMQSAAAMNPMSAMAIPAATPWLNLLDDEIVIAATGMVGFQPILMGMAEVKDPEVAMTMLKGAGMPIMSGGEYAGHEVNVSPVGFFQIHSAFIGNTFVMSTDPELFHKSIDGLVEGGGATASAVLADVPRNSQMIVAGDVEAIEKAVGPMAGDAVDDAFAGGRASDVVKQFSFSQRFDGQDQHMNLTLEGDPGLAIIRSALE